MCAKVPMCFRYPSLRIHFFIYFRRAHSHACIWVLVCEWVYEKGTITRYWFYKMKRRAFGYISLSFVIAALLSCCVHAACLFRYASFTCLRHLVDVARLWSCVWKRISGYSTIHFDIISGGKQAFLRIFGKALRTDGQTHLQRIYKVFGSECALKNLYSC